MSVACSSVMLKAKVP